LESSSLYVTSFSAITISATNISATNYFNLPGGGGSVDYNLLNTYYLNSSGDSASAGFYLSSVSATNLSATNYFNLPSSTLVWNQAQDVVLYVKNKSNFSLPKGTPVAIVSATGNNPVVEPLSSVNTHVPEAYGFANHVAGLVKDTISADGFGYIVVEGLIEGNGGADPLNTNAFQVGDTLYVSSNGQLSNVRPNPPYESHPIGFVIRAGNNNGKILVKIENQPEINDIVGFDLNSTLINGDLIAYDLTTSTFKNTQALNLSGVSRLGTVSATTYQNLPVSSHSQLLNLNANDHPQYVLTSVNTNLSSLVSNIQTSASNLSSVVGNHLASASVHFTSGSLSGFYAGSAWVNSNFVLTSVNNTLSTTVNNHLASAVHWDLATLNSNYINASGDSANAAFFFQTLSATTLSATTYQNLPTSALSGLSDTQITSPSNGQGLAWDGSKWVASSFPTGGGGGGVTDHGALTGLGDDDHPQYVLTSINTNLSSLVFNIQTSASNLSSVVGNHLASAVHWDLATLNSNYINASGDSATANFFFSNLSATNFSATTYLNLPASALSGLSDTQITSPSNGQGLAWDGSKWVASSFPTGGGGGGGATALSGLTDVSVTSTPVTGYVLKWDGSKWAPALDLPVITSGTAAPTGGNDGDIYIQYT
jgi:hypothetical protein